MDYIKRYNTIVPNGYNIQEGGKNPPVMNRKKFTWSEDKKAKRIGQFRGEKNPQFGKTQSDEQKKKISVALKKFHEENQARPREKRKSNIRRKVEKYDHNNVLVDTFDYVSEAARSINTSFDIIMKYANKGILYKGFYWKITDEIHVSGIPFGLNVGRDANRKKVYQYDLRGTYIAEHESLSTAARCVGGNVSTLSRCASEDIRYKKYETHKGFIWKFKGSTLETKMEP